MNARLRHWLMVIFSIPPPELRIQHGRLFGWMDRFLPKFVRRALNDVRNKIGRSVVGDVKCSANVLGTTVTLMDSRKYQYYAIFKRGEIYEPALTRRLTELFRSMAPVTFVDIGAHFGYFTVYAGKVLGPGSHVIAVEPHPEFYARLLKNVALNGVSERVRAFNVALAGQAGRARMTGWDERVVEESRAGGVEVVTLDELCVEQGIRPDVVKIDVHGAEGKVLAGMKNVLAKDVRHLFCELHDDLHGFTVSDLIRRLEEAGLAVFEFTGHRDSQGGDLVPLSDDLLRHPFDRVLYATRTVAEPFSEGAGPSPLRQ